MIEINKKTVGNEDHSCNFISCDVSSETLSCKGFCLTDIVSGIVSGRIPCTAIITIKQREIIKLKKISVPKKDDFRKPPGFEK
jgi:hypothetical protein